MKPVPLSFGFFINHDLSPKPPWLCCTRTEHDRKIPIDPKATGDIQRGGEWGEDAFSSFP
jgi:hypothetical protein